MSGGSMNTAEPLLFSYLAIKGEVAAVLLGFGSFCLGIQANALCWFGISRRWGRRCAWAALAGSGIGIGLTIFQRARFVFVVIQSIPALMAGLALVMPQGKLPKFISWPTRIITAVAAFLLMYFAVMAVNQAMEYRKDWQAARWLQDDSFRRTAGVKRLVVSGAHFKAVCESKESISVLGSVVGQPPPTSWPFLPEDGYDAQLTLGTGETISLRLHIYNGVMALRIEGDTEGDFGDVELELPDDAPPGLVKMVQFLNAPNPWGEQQF